MTPVETDVKATKRTDLMLVDAKNIIIEKDFNVRTDFGDMEGLMKSIVENGQIEPVIAQKVRGTDQYALTDGHRRFKAIQMAIEKGFDIPYIKVLPSTINAEDRIFAMVVTGTDKKPLTTLEEGEAYKRLVALTFEPKQIATRVGKSIAHIYNTLSLADAPQAIKNKIISGEISSTTVVSLIRVTKDHSKLLELIEGAEGEISEINTNKPTSKQKKITSKNITTLKSPMQKLMESLRLAETTKNQTAMDNLSKLIVALKANDTTSKQLVKLFS